MHYMVKNLKKILARHAHKVGASPNGLQLAMTDASNEFDGLLDFYRTHQRKRLMFKLTGVYHEVSEDFVLGFGVEPNHGEDIPDR